MWISKLKFSTPRVSARAALRTMRYFIILWRSPESCWLATRVEWEKRVESAAFHEMDYSMEIPSHHLSLSRYPFHLALFTVISVSLSPPIHLYLHSSLHNSTRSSVHPRRGIYTFFPLTPLFMPSWNESFVYGEKKSFARFSIEWVRKEERSLPKKKSLSSQCR